MGKVWISRRRGVLAAFAVALGALMLGVPGVQATNNPPSGTEPGTIIIKKQTIPHDENAFAFIFDHEVVFLLSDGGQRTFDNLEPGTYSVSEADPTPWTSSASCSDGSSPGSIDLSAGETVTCTFVNTTEPTPPPKPGTIIVQKQTNPDGDPTDFDFSFGESGFSLSDDEQRTFGELSAGTYSVAESTPEGWTLTSATCSDQSSPGSIQLSAGETVTCTFVNTKSNTTQPVDHPSSIRVSKSVSPAVVKEPGGPVTYSVTITNTSADVDRRDHERRRRQVRRSRRRRRQRLLRRPDQHSRRGEVNCHFRRPSRGRAAPRTSTW